MDELDYMPIFLHLIVRFRFIRPCTRKLDIIDQISAIFWRPLNAGCYLVDLVVGLYKYGYEHPP